MRVKLSYVGAHGSIFEHTAVRFPLGQPCTHSHDELELNVVTAGSASLLVGNRWQLLRRGSLVWLFPGQEHTLMVQESDFAMWVGNWHPKVVARHAAGLGDNRLGSQDPPGSWHRTLDSTSLRRLMDTCRQLSNGQMTGHSLVTGLDWLLCSAWSTTGIAPAGEMDKSSELSPQIARAIFLLQRPGAHDRLSTLAARCGLSPARLSRRFHAEVGRTLSAYRDHVRVQRAIDALHNGAPTLLDAALTAGFGSYTRFYTVFRRLTGKSPRTLQQDGGPSQEQ